MLNVGMLTMFLHLSNFGLGLNNVADFFNTGARAPTSAECTPCLPTWRVMWFWYMVWIRVTVIFYWLFFPHQLIPPLWTSNSSFLTELFDPGHWLRRFFDPASAEACHWPNFAFIHLTLHPPCCFKWLSVIYACLLFFGGVYLIFFPLVSEDNIPDFVVYTFKCIS